MINTKERTGNAGVGFDIIHEPCDNSRMLWVKFLLLNLFLCATTIGAEQGEARPAFLMSFLEYPGITHGEADRINRKGQVTGWLVTNGVQQGFFFDGRVMHVLEDIRPTALNNRGNIGGLRGTSFENFYGVVYRNGVWQDLRKIIGAPFPYVSDITDAGTILGSIRPNWPNSLGIPVSSFTLSGSKLKVFFEDEFLVATAMNKQGKVILSANGFGRLHSLHHGSLAFPTNFQPEAINDLGTVAGGIRLDDPEGLKRNAAVYRRGIVKVLGALPGDDLCMARAINNRGAVVGISERITLPQPPSGPPSGFFYHHDGLWNLNDIVGNRGDWVIHAAYDINAAGEIAASARKGFESRPVLLKPVRQR